MVYSSTNSSPYPSMEHSPSYTPSSPNKMQAEQLIREIQELAQFNTPQVMDVDMASQTLKRLEVCYLKLSHVVEEEPQKLATYKRLIERAIFTILFESHTQMSDEQILKQLATLPYPRNPQDVDVALTLYRQVQSQHPTEAFQALGQWVSNSNLPLVDLGWSSAQSLLLAPYLETLNLTQMKLSSQEIANLIQAASPNVKKVTFYFNSIDHWITSQLSRCQKLEDLSISRSEMVGEAQLPLTSFENLKSLEIDRLSRLHHPLDLRSSHQLTRFALNSCTEFNQPILLAPETSLQHFIIDNCHAWNQTLDLKDCQQLKEFKMNLCKAFNQAIDLQSARLLEALEITNCISWNSPLLLPLSNKLNQVDLSECRQFNQSLFFVTCPNVESINLTNCRAFNSDLTVDGDGPKKPEIDMTNCFAFKQKIEEIRTKAVPG